MVSFAGRGWAEPGIVGGRYVLRNGAAPVRASRERGLMRLAEGTTVWDALAKGMDDLMDLCNVVEEKFVQARNDFEQDRMQS